MNVIRFTWIVRRCPRFFLLHVKNLWWLNCLSRSFLPLREYTSERQQSVCLLLLRWLMFFFRLDFGCQQHLNADPSMSFWKERTEQTKPNRTEPGRIDRVYLNERLSSGCCASLFSSSSSSSSSSFSFFSTKDLHYTRIFNSECRAFPLLKDFLFILSSDG